MSRAGAGEPSLVFDGRIDLVRSLPVEAQGPATPGVVPDTGRDHAFGPGDAPHLPEAGDRVGHEVDDQLSDRRIERAVLEWQLLGSRLPDIDAGMTRERRGDEAL